MDFSSKNWDCSKVSDLLHSGIEPEQGWISLLNEANKRIADLEVSNFNLTKDTIELHEYSSSQFKEINQEWIYDVRSLLKVLVFKIDFAAKQARLRLDSVNHK